MKQKRHPGSAAWIAAVLSSAALAFSLAPAAAQAAPLAKEQPRQSQNTPRYNGISSDLDALTESAEDIYDLAWAGKMERVPKKLETLKRQAAALSYIKDDANSVLLPRLSHTLADLDQAVNGKSRLEIMRLANRITLITATVEIPFKPTVPTEVALLDYNGRELGLWSEIRKTDKLSSIVMRMHLTWQALMPKLVEHNGTRELRRFSDTMGRLEAAKTPEEYGRLSRQVAVEMAAVKAVFAKAPK
jgi:hypothetical protein